MGDTRLAAIRGALEDEKSSLARQLAEYGAAPETDRVDVAMDEGFADSAQVTAERSEMFSMVEQLRGTYVEVDDALRRIDQGTYGKCERCGREIAIERLEAIPTARLCLECKQAGRR